MIFRSCWENCNRLTYWDTKRVTTVFKQFIWHSQSNDIIQFDKKDLTIEKWIEYTNCLIFRMIPYYISFISQCMKNVNLIQRVTWIFQLKTYMLCRCFKWDDKNINFRGDLECLKRVVPSCFSCVRQLPSLCVQNVFNGQ